MNVTMTCEDIKQYAGVFVDGELDGAERADFEHHLSVCAGCQAHVDDEASFRAEFRGMVRPMRAPDALRDRIALALDAEPEPISRWAAFAETAARVAPFAVAASIIAVLAWPIEKPQNNQAPAVLAAGTTAPRSALLPPAPTVQPVSTAMAAFSTLPVDVSGQADQLQRFIQERVPFKASVPLEEGEGVALEGARAVTFEGQPAALFHFLANGQAVYVLQSRATEGAVDLRIWHERGNTVAQYTSGGKMHTVLSELSLTETANLLRARRTDTKR